MNEPVIEAAAADQAEAIAHVHYDAVHRTAAKWYSAALLDHWSSAIDAGRINQIQRAIADRNEIMLVAKIAGTIVGFGSIVPDNHELRAVYVHSSAGRKGVGTALLNALEQAAIERRLRYLEMDASLNAESFYAKNGYRVLERRTHTLSSGQEMECAKMRKTWTGC